MAGEGGTAQRARPTQIVWLTRSKQREQKAGRESISGPGRVHRSDSLGGDIDLGTLVTRMSSAPARIVGLPAPSISTGEVANLCVVDPEERWTVTKESLQSRSFNSAWLGEELAGKVKLTLAVGHVAWEDLG